AQRRLFAAITPESVCEFLVDRVPHVDLHFSGGRFQGGGAQVIHAVRKPLEQRFEDYRVFAVGEVGRDANAQQPFRGGVVREYHRVSLQEIVGEAHLGGRACRRAERRFSAAEQVIDLFRIGRRIL